MEIHLNQTHHTIGNFEGIFSYLKDEVLEKGKLKPQTLHIFPELFLTGYPLQDLCLQQAFIDCYQQLLEKINGIFAKLPLDESCVLLLGGPEYCWKEKDEDELIAIYNAVYLISPGKRMEVVYRKRLLPSYDVFDENKYFRPGHGPSTITWCGKRLAMLVCEDMWPSPHYVANPLQELKDEVKKSGPFDLIINLSASPFYAGKQEQRYQHAELFSRELQAPLIYVNRVGGEDHLQFDGQSFILNQNELIFKADFFKPHQKAISFPFKEKTQTLSIKPLTTFPSALRPSFPTFTQTTPPTLIPWSDEICQEVLESLIFGVQEYARKNGFHRFLVALSGGMDSALVVAILKIGLKAGQSIEAIYMPSKYSSAISREGSEDLCRNLSVNLTQIPIKFIHSTFTQTLKDHFKENVKGLTDENLQARIRAVLLYAHSNQNESLVINTSNKSELAVGYSTQYGDSVGAISLLGDLYKTQVYQLAKYINKNYGNPIPSIIIERAPSAELRENQTDQGSLPPYERLDAILELMLSYRIRKEKLLQMGFDHQEIEKILHLYFISEYKRYQFCPIIKVQSKSFGFGYRNPISKRGDLWEKTSTIY